MTSEGYQTVNQAAEGWGITPRRVRDFCANGRIAGAIQEGRNWKIPITAIKPLDRRTVEARQELPGLPVEADVQGKTTMNDSTSPNPRKRNMMGFCPDIKVVDCTLRDGGLVNNFAFTDEFVRDLYRANVAAGVDYMEFGYRADKSMFDPKECGKWKFTDEADLRSIVGDNPTGMKIAVMADAGRCDYKRDILPKKDSVVDMIRVACYVHQIPLAIDMLEDAKSKGYETTCNIMAVSKVSGSDLDAALHMVAASPADVLYLVDSFGNFYPETISDLARKYVETMSGKQAGFHGHNNQQLAFANTIEACRWGVNYLDATVNGLGRGAGNCFSEMILSFLKNPKFTPRPIFELIEKHILRMRNEGWTWGYDVPYLITGILNNHPRTAIKFIQDNRHDYAKFLSEIEEMV